MQNFNAYKKDRQNFIVHTKSRQNFISDVKGIDSILLYIQKDTKRPLLHMQSLVAAFYSTCRTQKNIFISHARA